MQNSLVIAALCLASPALGLWPTSRARACSPIPCAPSVFLPASGSVPGNAIAFLWQLPHDSTGAARTSASVHLYQLVDGQRSEVPTEVTPGPDGYKRVRATQALAEGSELVLESEEPACAHLEQTPARVKVGAANPKPTRLGTLEAGALEATTMNIPTARGSCTADFKVASVELTLDLDPGATAYADGMLHALWVDGERRNQRVAGPQGTWFGLGGKLEDTVYTLCGERSDSWTRDLAPGSHRIQWLATLPDGSELRSNEVSVDLHCPENDAGGEDQTTDTAAPDGGSGAVHDSGSDSGDNAESASVDVVDDTGDAPTPRARAAESCALHTASNSGCFGAWLLALGFLLVHRRRRA